MLKNRRYSYAQARLFLGISNVGFWVCLAVFVLFLGLPSQFFPTEPMLGKQLVRPLAAFLLAYIVLQAPFDWLGGYWLPKKYRRFYGDFSDFMTSWMRGVVVQSIVLVAISVTILVYAEWLLWLFVSWMALLLFLQSILARLLGRFHSRGANAWKSTDDAFTGGIAGVPGLQKAIFVTGRGQRLRAMDERRRFHLQKMFLPVTGVVMAATFNFLGFYLVSLFVHSPLDSVAGVVELSLGFTLWSFLGLLVLPSVSRPAVYAADYALFAKGINAEEFTHYLEYDFSQAGEESRSPWVERIFHPVPSPENRLARWGQTPGWGGGWHTARYAIYLSWAGLSLLNRAVHCNVGKPNVWVMLPCD